MRYCLDTSAYSQFRRGEPGVTALLDEAKVVVVPTVVLGELRAGFAGGARQGDNERMLRTFLAHPTVEIAPVDEDAATIYAELVTALRAAGTPLPTNDVWIAAVAGATGTTVVTYDAHFSRIARVGARILTTP